MTVKRECISRSSKNTLTTLPKPLVVFFLLVIAISSRSIDKHTPYPFKRRTENRKKQWISSICYRYDFLSKEAKLFRLDMYLEGEIVVISLDGNFGRFNTIEVIEKVEQQIRCQRYNVIFTMEGEKSIDNYGIEALVSSMSMVKVWGGKVILADIFKPIRDFPQFKSRLGEFEIYDTESEALKHVAV